MAVAVAEARGFCLTVPMIQAFAAIPPPSGQTLRLLTAQGVPPDLFTTLCQHLHKTLRQDNALQDLFWWQQSVPDAQKGALDDFAAFCRGCLLILLSAPDDPGTIVGIGWLKDIIPGVQAYMGVWYAKAYRQQHNPTPITRAILGWALQDLALPVLWAQSIHPGAQQHLLECGGETWATIPDYAYFQGKRHSVIIMRIAMDTWVPIL